MTARPTFNILAPANMTRRKLLQAMGAAGMGSVALAAGLRPSFAQDKTLNYFTWAAWGDKQFVEDGQKNAGVELKTTFYSSSDEMIAKLRGGGTRLYDLIVPVQNYVHLAAKANLIEPMSLSNLPNSDLVFDEFKNTEDWSYEGKLYGIPFVWGANAIAFNRKETGEVDSMDPLFDEKFKGRIAMRDEPEDSLAVGALRLGIKKPFQMGEAELQEVKKLLISQKPLVRSYWRDFADVRNMLASGEVVVAWTFLAVIAPLRQAGIDAGWVWPKEGAVGWSEGVSAVAGTKNLALVEQYANHTLSAEFGEMMARTTRYAPASRAAVEKLEPELVRDLGIDTSRISRLVFKQVPPDKSRWNEIWNEVKAA